MGCEVDFFPVGQESQSGDAIALRYGSLTGDRSEQMVVIVDGGFAENGEQLVKHVRAVYGTDRVDIVISTHPDIDHTSGLKHVLGNLEVGQLWLHLPWDHSEDISKSAQQGFASDRFSEDLTKSFTSAADLEAIARRRGIPIVEPFTDVSTPDGVVTVLGPDVDFYEGLLAEITGRVESSSQSIAEFLTQVARAGVSAVRNLLPESWFTEQLDDGGTTSASNNSSVITLLQVDGKALLLTGDAGMPALALAADKLEVLSLAGNLDLVQVPHHGSRRNVGPTVLNRILGGPVSENEERGGAVVSAAEQGASKHPAKMVTNAFLRRGYPVHKAKSVTTRYATPDAPDRPGYSPAAPLPLYSEVEEGGEE